MTRTGCFGWGFLIVIGCSDDGHVVGEMETEGAGGSAVVTVTSGGTASTASGGSGGAASSATVSGTETSSGGTGASGGAANASIGSTTGSGGSGVANSTGGHAGTDASSGGTSGAAGETVTGTGGGGPCEPGETWCPGCTPDEGICTLGGCPGVACASCTEITTLEECEAAPGCHAVFNDPQTCGCAEIGCCARFAFCADGGEADCEGPVTCAAGAPFCEEPVFVPSYVNDCIEGCVRPEVCAN
ncbi:MAG TPA: hypothetical protein VFU02_11880 [Polyangiaceae bacterium]|nr:hypothetical protein [Polyangiaceae bacterium]